MCRVGLPPAVFFIDSEFVLTVPESRTSFQVGSGALSSLASSRDSSSFCGFPPEAVAIQAQERQQRFAF